MNSRFRIRVIDLMALAGIVGLVLFGYLATYRAPKPRVDQESFAQKVDLSPLYRIAVQADGRLRSFESHAKTYMGYVSGARVINGQSNGFTYLDLMLRPQKYVEVELFYVANKPVRQQMVDLLRKHTGLDAAGGERIMKSGLVSRTQLEQPAVSALLERLGQDLIRTAKVVDALQSALAVSDPRFLMDNLRVVAPPSGKVDQPWMALSALVGNSAPSDARHADVAPQAKPLAGLEPQVQEKMTAAWNALRQGWNAEDPAAVNGAMVELAALLPTVSPGLYPTAGRLGMESWYFRTSSMTWVWLLYLAAVVPLLMSIIYHWDGARKVGMGLFLLAFAAHTVSTGIRWYISGRWPNSNMFEAVTTSAWFGGVLALILERLARKTALRNLFALGSAIMSMGALMAAYYLPAQLDSAINNKMAALNDIWLYIHTNMIIWSYAVIGLACVPALLFLRHRWCLLWDNGALSKARLFVLPVALAVFNYTAYRLLMHALDDPSRELATYELWGYEGACWGSAMILMVEMLAVRARRAAGVAFERGISGGTAALMSSAPLAGVGANSGSSFLRPEAPTASQVYDGATMVLVELSFIMLWTGIVMGAIWADHSWGRPWGWDPKEVFALNTFLIFLILIHVRMKVRDKGFWTAVLAIIGFEVMMFNWIVVNFVISGLHSYA